MTVDYQALLQKYIAYVRELEGQDYITALQRRESLDISFSDCQWAELERLANAKVEEETDARQ